MYTGTVTLVQTLAAEATPRRARRAREDMAGMNRRRRRVVDEIDLSEGTDEVFIVDQEPSTTSHGKKR